MKNRFTLFIVHLFVTTHLFSQTHFPNLEWANKITEGGYSAGNSISIYQNGKSVSTGTISGNCDLNSNSGLTDTAFIDASNGGGYVSELDSAGNLLWAKGFLPSSDVADIFPRSVKADKFGNIYIVGEFYGTFDFNTGTSALDTLNLTSQDPFEIYGWNSFIVKLDESGNFIWAKTVPTGYGWAASVAIDNDGNSYTTGYFLGNLDFDPGSGDYFLNSGAHENMYVLKLDPAGNFQWAKQIGTLSGNVYGESIGLDDVNNIYVTGIFNGVVDFDPDTTESFSIVASPDPGAMFVLKLNSSGEFVWANKVDNALGKSLVTDKSNSVYVTGHFSGTTDFNPGLSVADTVYLTSASTSVEAVNSFVLKLTSGGNFSWVIAQPSDRYSDGQSISVDSLGYVYTLGWLLGNGDFNPGSTPVDTFYSGSGYIYTSYLLKTDTMGHYVWSTKWSPNAFLNAVTTDKQGIVYATGYFNLTVDFDPDTTIYDLTADEYGTSGCVLKMGQCISSLGTVVISQYGDSLVGPTAANYQWFRNDTLIEGAIFQSYRPTENGNYSLCCSAHGETCTVCSPPFRLATNIETNTLSNNAMVIYPNPSSGQFSIDIQLNIKDNYILEFIDELGHILYKNELKNFTGNYKKQFNETKYDSGIYFFRVVSNKGLMEKKIVIW